MELGSSGSGDQLIEGGGTEILSLPELPRERIDPHSDSPLRKFTGRAKSRAQVGATQSN
jgi:hypothetical protein